jgi:L-lactate dehydrogenase
MNAPALNRIPRIAIVGMGFVGSTTAYALLLSGINAELILVDTDNSRAEGHADDLRDAQIFSHTCQISASTLSDCHDVDLFVITAGTSQSKLTASRFEGQQESAEILRSIVPQIPSQNPSAVLVIASNPVDVLTYAAWKWSGFAPNRVFGSGTSLDTSRLRRRLGAHCRVSPESVHAYVIGEHGESQVAILSSAQVAGLPLKEFCQQQGALCSDAAFKELADQARKGGFEILRDKGATYYGIGAALARIARSVLVDEHAVITVSSLAPASMGLGEVCLSLPAVISRSGISDVLVPRLSADEDQALRKSASVLTQHIGDLRSVGAVA